MIIDLTQETPAERRWQAPRKAPRSEPAFDAALICPK